MRRIGPKLAVICVATVLVYLAPIAHAHQGVDLTSRETTPERGPLLVDGTVSFAVRTDVERGAKRGFRFRLDEGDTLAVQLLIVDEAPGNTVSSSQLPRVTITDPDGRTIRLVINERTKFYEPYGGTNYLYLSRVERDANPGTYSVSITGRSSVPVETVIGVGYREVPGEVRRR